MSSDHVARNTRRGISSNLLAAVVVNFARVAVLMILGRKLTQGDYGLVAAAVTVNTIIFGLRDLGLGQALVQRKDIVLAHVETTVTVALLNGVVATLGLWFAAPLIAWAFAMPNLVWIVRGLAPLFLMGGMSLVSRCLCQRELRFVTIAGIDTVAFLCGAAASIVLAIVGAGPWALVVGYLVEEFTASTAYLIVRPPPLRLRIDRQRLYELLRYGASQTAAQIVGMIAIQADNMIVGRAFGKVTLGLYSRAYELVKFPSQVFTAVVGNVLFSSFSRVQEDVVRVGLGFKRGLYVNALLLLPGSAWVVICAHEIVTSLIGKQWDDAVLPFQILAVTILFRTSQKLSALVVQTQGKINTVLIIYIGYMVAIIVGSLLAVPFGMAAVAVSTAICISLVTAAMTVAAMRLTGIGIGAVMLAHLPGSIGAAAVAAVCWPLVTYLREQHLSSWLLLAITGVVSAAVALLSILMTKRILLDDFRWLLSQLPGKKRQKSPSMDVVSS
jgi:O-antigen/teichoic acid export membrane protein